MADREHDGAEDQDEVYLDLGRTGARWGALLVAFWSAVMFYGAVDLAVVPTQDDGFYDSYLLETGWGVLFTFLVPLPLVLFAVHLDQLVHVHQSLAVSLGMVLAAILAPSVGQLALGLFLAAVGALLLVVAAGRPHLPRRWQAIGGGRALFSWVEPVLTVLALVALVGGIAYALDMTRALHDGETDDVTWNLRHLPMQAALGLALAGTALVTAGGAGVRAAGWRASAVAPALSAAWLGVVSVVYPHHTGSLGSAGGVAALVWGVLFLGASLVVRRR
ncbi:hypothetical protein EKO23_07070 [Nocardioides guangzhouensis]|uniref:Uncharacterized protein n=1 Tax=Nocardioides guangzhouensis TaxID=2497878 RepID=A0A4Q4ZHQ8_9ACTN|nr:hypothetical protein [Nocardioides guangzhouensis]RYP87031.1 hypothetical protein EKO23_07070 [Nocardioides guangzhouensis]